MTTSGNIANLKLDESFPNEPYPYLVTFVSTQENPYDHIPDGCSLLAFDDFNFSLEVWNLKKWSCENAVVNNVGDPVYLIGEFVLK